jgi:hypothetical protein
MHIAVLPPLSGCVQPDKAKEGENFGGAKLYNDYAVIIITQP